MAANTAVTVASCFLDPTPDIDGGAQLEALRQTCCSFSSGACEQDCIDARNGVGAGTVPTGMSQECYDQMCPWLAGSSNAVDVVSSCFSKASSCFREGMLHFWLLITLTIMAPSLYSAY